MPGRNRFRAFAVSVSLVAGAAALVAAGPVGGVSLQLHGPAPTVSPIAIGVNLSVADGNQNDPKVPHLLSNAGVRFFRWPGGSIADTFDWRSNLFEFQDFLSLYRAVGAKGAVMTVNYGTGTPQEAAAWVRYADVTHHDGLQYWEIGNEIYGDGEYGTPWEEVLRPHKGPAAYALNLVKFAKAMRAVDPRIQIGAVATIPGVWPSGIPPYWDRTILPIVAPYINFVVLHYYPENPGQENDAALLQDPSNIAQYMATLHQYLARYASGRKIQVFVDETNSVSSNPGKQSVSLVNALFLAEDYAAWIANGATTVDWWDLHDQVFIGNLSSKLYGHANYGDYGLLSSGGSNGTAQEPPADTPFPSYYGLVAVHRFLVPGEKVYALSPQNPLISLYAARSPSGTLRLLAVNQSRSRTLTVRLTNAPSEATVRYFYGQGSPHVMRSAGPHLGASVRLALPPYSITVLTPKRRNSAGL